MVLLTTDWSLLQIYFLIPTHKNKITFMDYELRSRLEGRNYITGKASYEAIFN